MVKLLQFHNSLFGNLMQYIKKLQKLILAPLVTILIIVTSLGISNLGLQQVNAEDTFVQLTNNQAFRIVPTKAKSMVLDSFGDKLPSWKTKVHLYSKSGSDATSELIGYLQPENNNSYELHMQNDRNLCIGPDVSSASDVRNGTPMVVKRDCANTMNHVHEGDQLRVNNTNFCVDVPNADFKLLKQIQYHTCNQSSAQLLKLIRVDTDAAVAPKTCYRPSNGLFGADRQLCTDRNVPLGFKKIEWTGGAYATIIFYTSTPESSSDTTEVGTGGFAVSHSKNNNEVTKAQYYLTNDTGEIELPQNAQTYTIKPWNDNATTRFQFVK
jgi:hypothetical protein